jgi:hypothetical protein
MPYSELFNGAASGNENSNVQWHNSNVQLDYDANHVNPDGSTGTWYGNTYTSGSVQREIYDYFDASSANTDTLTFSLFCKRRDSNSQFIHFEVFVSVGDATYGTDGLFVCCIFNPEDGTFHTESGPNDSINATAPLVTTGANNGRIITNRTAIQYPNDWWRVSFTVQLNGDSNQSPVFTNSSRFDIQNLHQCYIWGAQVVKGTEAGDYYKTTGTPSGPPRYSHDPETLTPTGLYLEPASTNLMPYSEDLSQSSSFEIQNAYKGVISTNAGTAPDGSSADAFIGQGQTGRHSVTIKPTITINNDEHTFSVFVKRLTGSSAERYVNLETANYSTWTHTGTSGAFDLETGTRITNPNNSNITSGIEKYPNGWYRIFMTSTTGTVTGSTGFYINFADSNNGYGSTTIPSNEGILIWGAQVEQNTLATSYIPTSGATATRAADIFTSTATEVLDRANGTKPAFYTKNGLTAFVRGTNQPNPPTYAFRFFEFTGGVAAGSADLSVTANTSGTKIGIFQSTSANHAEPQGIGSGETSPNTTLGLDNKIAVRYQTDNARLNLNGEEGALADSSLSNGIDTRSSNRLCIGANGGTNQVGTSRIINGTIQRLTFWKTPLPDNKLDRLTS